MSDSYLEDIGEILLKKETLKALYYAPVPILIVRDDEKISFINQTIIEATGLKPEAIPSLEALTEHLQIFPKSELPLHPSLFFNQVLLFAYFESRQPRYNFGSLTTSYQSFSLSCHP